MGFKWALTVFAFSLYLLAPTSAHTADLSSKLAYASYRSSSPLRFFVSKSELEKAMKYAETNLNRWETLENNLMSYNVMPKKGTPSYTAMLDNKADDEAVKIARDAFIRVKASEFISYYHCTRYGIKSSECVRNLSSVNITCNSSNDQVEPCLNDVYRSLTGNCNNPVHPNWGKRYTPYSRLLPTPAYDNGLSLARGTRRKIHSPIKVSSSLVKEGESSNNKYTLALMAWSKVVANDLSHTVSYRMMQTGMDIMCCSQNGHRLAPRYLHPLCMPLCDDHRRCISYVRSMLSTPESCTLGPGEQMNGVSHFLDGSSIYGSTSKKASFGLRTGDKGLLKVRMVKENHSLLEMSNEMCTPDRPCALVGDKRVNLDIVSTVLHTLLVREHNRLATHLNAINPQWSDEKLYQEARRILIAQIQHITYHEWLPLIIGETLMVKYDLKLPKTGYSNKYNQYVNPGVSNEFANAAIRFMASLVKGNLNLVNEQRKLVSRILLRESFLVPDLLKDPVNFDALVRGLATQHCQSADLQYSEAVTKFLYSNGNETGANALGLDIQRGREHGLSPYTEYRKLFKLPHSTFADLGHSISKSYINQLKKLYFDIHDIDLIVGGMSEEPLPEALLGPVFSNIVAKQLYVTLSSDRFFYTNKNQPKPFTPEQLLELQKTSLARIFCNNGNHIKMMQPNIFVNPGETLNILTDCSNLASIPQINLEFWKDSS